ncbi:DUF6286 domain-containing protein [Streptomyces sp. JB150]|uniref:DUF6286 domain-containing protein n=1 Tax=Streptomyces sp. JB150 TaxID=2714844 RepID=UPI00140C0E93|nr:DUF6286 domain-containing protein [Streptomyces sp. JB150]QIJ61926.1 hypothetical protein G7Z13_07640 [Streptomyces sp. JB150]
MSEPHGSPGTTRPVPVLEKDAPDATTPGTARRFWSARRVPAGIAAVLLLALVGLFLYDIAAVRAGRPGMRWRRALAGQLAERPLDDVWVLTGAAVAAALGLWLLLLALTPGLRSLLPMRRTHPDVRAVLDRPAAAAMLRDRAMDVSGVQSARVRVRRRKADVRAVSHFRELDDVRADLDAVLGEAVTSLGLARPPTLSVRVRRPGRKG